MKKTKTIITTLLAALITVATAFTLTACGHSHEFSETWENDAANHWHICADKDCNDVADKAEHNFVSKITVNEKAKVCSDCGYKIVTSIAEERFSNAMALKDEEGNYYTNFEIALIASDTTLQNKYKVTENAAYAYTIASDADNLETIWTNENGKGVIYAKHDADSEWVRTEQESEYADFASLILPKNLVIGQDKLTYGITKYIQNDFSYHAVYETTNNRIVSAKLFFEDGKLINVSQTTIYINRDPLSSFVGLRTITYGNAVIDIPTVNTAE